MAPYIFTERNGIHIIDLQKSVGKVDEAYRAVFDVVSQGGTILFVGTKKQAQDAVKTEAERCGMYYVNERWLGGMLTNFKTMRTRIDRLAQIGFVVITVGNRGGHPDRSKWYHNYGYGNLRDYGLKDKVVAAQQLAARYPWIDIDRVGIHGHSGGGFMSTAAILMYPDFFKAAVSCAGNHDNRIYNRWWSEKHHGIKEQIDENGDTTFVYKISTNPELASRLKGHLLLVHGDMDDNVHPGNTIRVVDALIKANKRFDMLILPGQHHGFGSMNEYFFWKLADYFAEHLLGEREHSVDIPQLNNDI